MNKTMRLRRPTLTLGVVCLLSNQLSPSHAQVHKCVRANGITVFSDTPCEPARASPKPRPGSSSAADNSPLSSAARKAIIAKWEAELTAEILRRPLGPPQLATSPAPGIPAALASQRLPMPFEQCKAQVSRMLLAVAGSAKTQLIVNHSEVTITRICTSDGSVLVTCSALDRVMITTKSPTKTSC